jgi:GntR family transcriptional repressor for pyruvate dehydrogenase complex
MSELERKDASPTNATVDALNKLVIEELEPGSQLPSEASLAESLGVSRLTVREALKVLSGRGLVELQRGKRAVVREPDSSVLSVYLKAALRRDPRGFIELL